MNNCSNNLFELVEQIEQKHCPILKFFILLCILDKQNIYSFSYFSTKHLPIIHTYIIFTRFVQYFVFDLFGSIVMILFIRYFVIFNFPFDSIVCLMLLRSILRKFRLSQVCSYMCGKRKYFESYKPPVCASMCVRRHVDMCKSKLVQRNRNVYRCFSLNY